MPNMIWLSKNTITTFGSAESGPTTTPAGAPVGIASVALGSDIGEFFRRPIEIYSTVWQLGNLLDFSIYPWLEWRRNPAIAKKIAGYSRVRGNLHLRFVVNCSPFHYSKMLFSYKPMAGQTEDFSGGQVRSASLIGADGVDVFELIGFSQRLHIEMLPQQSPQSDMILPFVWHREWLDNTAILSGQEYLKSDHMKMGRLDGKSFSKLRTVGTSLTGSATVTVFAWMEDIQLEGPSYYPQGDEYAVPPVSVMATAVAEASDMLGVANPVLASKTTLVSAAARMTSVVAKALGYSAPNVVANDVVTRNRTMPNTSNTTIGSAFEMLSLDPKAGLESSDINIGGPGIDELHIGNYCGRRSYWFAAEWTDVAPVGSVLTNWYVTPECYAVHLIEGPPLVSAIQMTPCCHAAQMFRYWRGTMEYTVSVPRTRYHQGKLRITFDPAGGDDLDPALQRNFIMDLGEDEDLVFTVPYMPKSAHLRVGAVTADTAGVLEVYSDGSADPPFPYTPERFNGRVTVSVLNQLSSPADLDEVTILVYVRMLDPVFGYPKGIDDREGSGGSSVGTVYDYSYIEPYVAQGSETEVSDMGIVRVDADSLTYFGERIVSLRALLERTMPYEVLRYSYSAISASAGGTFRYWRVTPRYPRSPGPVNTGNTATRYTTEIGTDEGYVQAPFNPMTYLAPCFVGQRGSVRWRHFPFATKYDGASGFTSDMYQFAQRLSRVWRAVDWGAGNGQLDNEFATVYTSAIGTSKYATYAKGFTRNCLTGMSAAMSPVEPVLHTDAPMYTNVKMFPTSLQATTLPGKNGALGFDTEYQYDNIEYVLEGPGAVSANTGVFELRTYVSAGADYALVMFVNVPTLYKYLPPTPSTTGRTVGVLTT